MRWKSFRWSGRWMEWVETEPKRWALLGTAVEVFHLPRGWFAQMGPQTLGPFRSKEQAMRAAMALFSLPRRSPWTQSARFLRSL